MNNLILLALLSFANFETTFAFSVGLSDRLYCGLETCYDVLNISREEFNKSELSKIYRKLARQYHPDRVKAAEDKPAAEEKFRLIATAYETLKDEETKQYYDYYLDNPDERYYNYYQYYRMKATPKVDVRLVILLAILLISAIQYLSAHQKYYEALKYAKEQAKFRNMAIDIARERGLVEVDKQGKPKKKQKSGITTEEIISAIIEENISICGGYKKQSVYNTLIWQLICLPMILYRYLAWWTNWIVKYWIRKNEYDDEAKLYLIRTKLKMSEEQFLALEERIVADYMHKELWVQSKFDEWKEAKEIEEKEKLASSGRHRQYKRYMKKQAGSTISFLED